jgi:hypothetical protein
MTQCKKNRARGKLKVKNYNNTLLLIAITTMGKCNVWGISSVVNIKIFLPSFDQIYYLINCT